MSVSSTHDASARIADLFGEWEDAVASSSSSVAAAPSVVLCEVFGAGVLQQLILEVLGSAPLRDIANRSTHSADGKLRRTVVCANAVNLTSATKETAMLSAAYSTPSSNICSANVLSCDGARRVVYRGSLSSLGNPEVLWDSSAPEESELLNSGDDLSLLQSRMSHMLRDKLHSHRTPMLMTVSVGQLSAPVGGDQRGAADSIIQWFDIHVADGIGGSGLLPEVVARCCSAVVAESSTVTTYDAADASSLRFWIPFLNLLHPRQSDAAVLVSVASSSHLIELHYFHDVMKKFFDASNDEMLLAVTAPGGPSASVHRHPTESEASAGAPLGAKKLVAEHILADHGFLCGVINPFVSDVSVRQVVDPLHSTSPPPKDPHEGQKPAGGTHGDSMEMLIEESHNVPISQTLLTPGVKVRKEDSPDSGAVLPNSSTYVSVADGSSMMSPPQRPGPSRAGKVAVASVFDRLLASTSPVVRRRPSNSPNAGRRPFGGGSGKPHASTPTVSGEVDLRSRAQPKRSTSADRPDHPIGVIAPQPATTTTVSAQPAEGDDSHELLVKQFETLQTKFDTTIMQLTKESETKLIAKERELARLTSKVSALQAQLDTAIEDTLQSTRTPQQPRTTAISEDEIQQLRASLEVAEVTARRTEEDKNRLERMLEFSKREAESKTAALDQQLKRQQQRLELAATKKLADEASQHEARFALARSALEKQVEALANENQMLKNDKKNLVASMRMLRQAAAGGGSDFDASAPSSAVVEQKLTEMKGQLMEVRLELSHIHNERDSLRQQDETKSEQISTLQATIDMLKSQLAAERKSGGGVNGSDNHSSMMWAASPSSSQQELQSFPAFTAATSTGGVVRRPTGPVAVSRQPTSHSQRAPTGSPVRPGVAHYLMQQRLDPNEVISPRKASLR